MKKELLEKYLCGEATESERQKVMDWINSHPDHMREFMAMRRLHDITIWRTNPVKKSGANHVRMWLKYASVAAVIVVAFLCGVFLDSAKTVEETFQTLEVPAGHRAKLFLADGTEVWLNSASKFTFSDFKGAKERVVKLDGEGYFKVTKDDYQPFIVKSGAINIRVLGTEFNVMAYSSENFWETSLLKGSVELLSASTNKKITRMKPNMKVSVVDNKMTQSAIIDMNHFRWTEGLICFNNISVGDLFKKFERYYDVKIHIQNDSILTRRFTGKFRIDDGIEHSLKVLMLHEKFSYKRIDETNEFFIY